MKVRAKATHTEPGTQRYRVEGEEFDREGKLYKHVEPVKESQVQKSTEATAQAS